MADFQQQYALWDEFLSVWPVSRLASMTIDEYTQAGSQDSFTYWIESRLDKMGSIWGGSAFKFGVFSRKSTESKPSDAKLSYSDDYGWYSTLGDTADEAFEKVRGHIVQVAQLASKGELDAIEAFEHLGSGLVIIHSQKMTRAARAIADRNTVGDLSYRVATLLQSFSLPNMISIWLRRL